MGKNKLQDLTITLIYHLCMFFPNRASTIAKKFASILHKQSGPLFGQD